MTPQLTMVKGMSLSLVSWLPMKEIHREGWEVFTFPPPRSPWLRAAVDSHIPTPWFANADPIHKHLTALGNLTYLCPWLVDGIVTTFKLCFFLWSCWDTGPGNALAPQSTSSPARALPREEKRDIRGGDRQYKVDIRGGDTEGISFLGSRDGRACEHASQSCCTYCRWTGGQPCWKSETRTSDNVVQGHSLMAWISWLYSSWFWAGICLAISSASPNSRDSPLGSRQQAPETCSSDCALKC